MIRSLPGGRWLHGAGLACVLLLLPGVLPADGLSVDEQAAVARSRVEAAYLFKFTDFVTWPEQSFAAGDSPIVVTVVADESLARDLELAAAGKQVQGRSLRVSRRISVRSMNAKGSAIRPKARYRPKVCRAAG